MHGDHHSFSPGAEGSQANPRPRKSFTQHAECQHHPIATIANHLCQEKERAAKRHGHMPPNKRTRAENHQHGARRAEATQNADATRTIVRLHGVPPQRSTDCEESRGGIKKQSETATSRSPHADKSHRLRAGETTRGPQSPRDHPASHTIREKRAGRRATAGRSHHSRSYGTASH
jgi:hypothetical protein